jgi:hypothetical protein
MQTSCFGEFYSLSHNSYLLRSEQAYKYIFTSPSSVEKEVKATRSGNARLHGMTRVTTASLAYVATQVHPATTPFIIVLII